MLKKSITIAGRHSTSISIEKEFWDELVKIAQTKGLSLNQLITQIDQEKAIPNLSSAIRIFVLNSLRS